jgi:hypothetical protein
MHIDGEVDITRLAEAMPLLVAVLCAPRPGNLDQWGPDNADDGVVLVHSLGSTLHIWDFVGDCVVDGPRLPGEFARRR